MLRFLFIFCVFILSVVVSFETLAKREKKLAPADPAQTKLANLSSEDRELFDSLTKKQQKDLLAGKISPGDNAWMVTFALGKPFYASEHHPVFVDYEQVWLYTRPDVDEKISEEKIIDRQTNWPTVHRMTTRKVCQVGDVFVLFDRGVVQRTEKDTSGKIYGSCTIENREEFLPIVDEKARQK